MILYLLAAAVAQAVVPATFDLHHVPVEYGVVSPVELRVPVSASVRAATWDEFPVKSAYPFRMRLACIVWTHSGAVGACVAASLVPAEQKDLDWTKLRANDEATYKSSNNLAAAQMQEIAGRRLHTALLAARRGSRTMFVIRFFDEVVGPADAREPFASGEALKLSEVAFKRPLDSALPADLYPSVAVRHAVTARVTVDCLIQPTLNLLCRDPGSIQMQPTELGGDAADIQQALRFATYQLASTLQPEALDKGGMRQLAVCSELLSFGRCLDGSAPDRSCNGGR